MYLVDEENKAKKDYMTLKSHPRKNQLLHRCQHFLLFLELETELMALHVLSMHPITELQTQPLSKENSGRKLRMQKHLLN